MAVTQRDGATIVEHSITLDASADEVYKAIADPGEMSRWFTSRASGESMVGSRYRFEFDFDDTSRNHTMHGEFTALEPGAKVGYTWSTAPEAALADDDSSSQVEYAISSSGGQTRVDLTHSGFGPNQSEQRIAETDQGWGFFLPNLKSVLDDGADNRTAAMGQIIE